MLKIPYLKCLGPEVSDFSFFSDFGILYRFHWLRISNLKNPQSKMLQNPKLLEHHENAQKVSEFQ
jgi:hypothetical protein